MLVQRQALQLESNLAYIKNYFDLQPCCTIVGPVPSSSASPLDSKPEEDQLLKVCEMVLEHWRDVCIYLRIPKTKISESEQNHAIDNKQACFAAMLWWLEGNCREKNRPPTWIVLLDAMKEAGLPDKAKEVEEKIM